MSACLPWALNGCKGHGPVRGEPFSPREASGRAWETTPPDRVSQERRPARASRLIQRRTPEPGQAAGSDTEGAAGR